MERDMEISEQDFTAAVARGEQTRQGGYAVTAEYDRRQGRLVVGSQQRRHDHGPGDAEGLADAADDDLTEIEITLRASACIGPG
jgi:hypothetical protein